MNKHTMAIARAVGVIGSIGVIVAGATYALTSQAATLTSSSMTATAGLQISADNNNDYGATANGFDFAGMVPGGVPSGNQTFYLYNNGNTDLTSINLQATEPVLLVAPTQSVGFNHIFVNISCTTGSSGDIDTTANTGNDFATLSNGTGTTLTGGLKVGDYATCTANTSADGAGQAFPVGTSSITTTTGFNLAFTGANGS